MPTSEPFQGVIGRTIETSQPWWPPLRHPPEGAPNVLVVLLDDVGYAQFGCYGSDIATPTFDRLAAGGLRYANFHTTALCSPTRAALLTGRNHHSNGMGRITELATGFPGYDAEVPRENGMLSEILLRQGYATLAIGKWHLTSGADMAMGGPKSGWPLGRGFERFYGFLSGETDQFHPDLVHDNHQVDPPRSPAEGYHLTEDLVDQAIQCLKDVRAYSADKRWFLWFAPGACHAPHQVPESHRDLYRGRFDQGWDAWREEVFARQTASGLLPPGTRLSERPQWVPAWDSLDETERRVFARMMEIYAAFLTHTDAQVGRLLEFVEGLGELDDTLILLMSDNGASAEGGAKGSFNELYFFNFEPESMEENLARLDQLGGPEAYNHYPWGWAWAGNTPLKRWKRETHEGGVCDPLIVHWPAGIGRPGATRHHYVHAVDVLPTVLDALRIDPPAAIDGIAQNPVEGTSFAPTLTDPDAPDAHRTQYYEMLGSRALYHDGWKAVVFRPLPFTRYTERDDPDRSFEDDDWELYHVAEDFSEVDDLSGERPEKLAELVDLWWSEAERYQVLPVTNQVTVGMDRRHRRRHYEYLPGIGAVPRLVAPDLSNRPWVLTAELVVPSGELGGAVACFGSHAGGYAVHVRDRRLQFDYNHLATTLTSVTAEAELPDGRVDAKVVFRPTGGTGGDVDLYYGDVPVGHGHVPRTALVTLGVHGFTVGYQRGSDISPRCRGRAEFTPGALRKVVVETASRGEQAPSEDRVGMATQ